MSIRNKFIILVITCLFAGVTLAQNMTSSPFSRYAYGDLNINVPTAYRAMGGVGIGMRNNKVICSSQPASYTACDSLTFMMDIAASATWSRYADASGMKNKANGNLEYLTIQLPLWQRWIGVSVGVQPYSSVGYDILLSDSVGGYNYHKAYTGDGNISEIYGGLSFNICDWFAVGANIYYMWGDLSRMRALTFEQAGVNTTIQNEILSVSSVRLRYGAQFFHTWGEHGLTIGAIYENKMKLNSSQIVIETQTQDSIPIYQEGWEVPMVYGLGASYNWGNRLSIGFDYERQCMASALYNGGLGKLNGLQDHSRYAAGVEYRHNANSRKYVERMIWRVGVSIQDEYLTSIGSKRLSASVGIGFPLHTIGTVINTTVEYTHRGNSSGLEENSLRFTIGASIAENWFFKRKL